MNLVGFPNEFEIDAQLRTCAVELGLDIPALTECLRRYARILAEDLLVGRVAPGDGRRALIRVFEKLGDFVAMSDWIGAEDALELARDGVHGTSEAAEERVRRQAATLVNGATGATSSRRDV